jgi:hypothetical protein
MARNQLLAGAAGPGAVRRRLKAADFTQLMLPYPLFLSPCLILFFLFALRLFEHEKVIVADQPIDEAPGHREV